MYLSGALQVYSSGALQVYSSGIPIRLYSRVLKGNLKGNLKGIPIRLY
jgi:hypothetical protein